MRQPAKHFGQSITGHANRLPRIIQLFNIIKQLYLYSFFQKETIPSSGRHWTFSFYRTGQEKCDCVTRKFLLVITCSLSGWSYQLLTDGDLTAKLFVSVAGQSHICFMVSEWYIQSNLMYLSSIHLESSSAAAIAFQVIRLQPEIGHQDESGSSGEQMRSRSLGYIMIYYVAWLMFTIMVLNYNLSTHKFFG